MLAFVKRHWVLIAVALIVAVVLIHKNCDGCQKRFSAIKNSMNPLNANIIGDV